MCTVKLKVLNYGFPSIFVENYQSLWSAGQRFSPFMHHMPVYAKRAAHICAPSLPVLASTRALRSIFIGHRQKTSGPEKNQQAISEMMADERNVRFSQCHSVRPLNCISASVRSFPRSDHFLRSRGYRKRGSAVSLGAYSFRMFLLTGYWLCCLKTACFQGNLLDYR